jgi:hypothetical protein
VLSFCRLGKQSLTHLKPWLFKGSLVDSKPERAYNRVIV